MRQDPLLKFFTVSDVSKALAKAGDPLSPDGVRLAVASGRLHLSAITIGGVKLFTRADVDTFISERKKGRR